MPGYEEMPFPLLCFATYRTARVLETKITPFAFCCLWRAKFGKPHSETYSHSLCVFLHKKRSCFKVSCCNYKNLTSNNPVAFGNPLFSRVLGISTLAKDDIIVGISIGYYQFVL